MKIDRVDDHQLLHKLHGDQNTQQQSSSIKGNAAGHTDKVTLSAEGRLLLELRDRVATLKQDLAALPDVRQDKVELARQRLASGYYDRAEVQERIAESLLDSFGF
jgi:flagellar biosynthesis anti-sigma factor FlgM